MAEVKSTRSTIITVDKVSRNEYDDLIFTDKEGKEYKVSNKRAKWFEGIILPNTAVKLNFAEAYGKEYIYNAELIKDMLRPPIKETQTVELPAESPVEPVKKPQIAPQEKGMWWKEVGENFRAKLFDKDKENGKILWDLYIKQMLSSLEITLPPKEVQPSKLVEAAKKMGAVEIKEK